MPPAFTAEEKARIAEQLLETGGRLFTSQGLPCFIPAGCDLDGP